MVVRTVTVTEDEVREWLTREAQEAGMSFPEFVEQGKDDTLDDPNLRDLWLIWGDMCY